MRTKIIIKSGKIFLGKDKLEEIYSRLSDGEYIVSHYPLAKPKSLEDWRKLYFFLRDILFEDGETGYTRDELHELVKSEIMRYLPGDCFINHIPFLSATKLNEIGWEVLIKRFKEWSFEKFNCYL